MQQDYTYAVARIRCRETRLLSEADISQLVSAKDSESAVRMLRDKGWGENNADNGIDELIAAEEDKLWAFISEIVPDMSVFGFLSVPNDYHNLKVAVKCITRGIKPDGMFIYSAPTDPDKLYELLLKREYDSLPEHLKEPAKEAVTILLQTSDGQLCDMVADKACLEHVYRLGKENDSDIIKLYCELFVAFADIKIAVRAAKTGKPLELIRRAVAQCDSLDAQKLAFAASLGYDDITAYIANTRYSSAVEALNTSMSAFEKWGDDYLTGVLKPQKWEPFGVGPVVAYILARENELKAVRLILSAKQNNLPEEIVKERLRMMYV